MTPSFPTLPDGMYLTKIKNSFATQITRYICDTHNYGNKKNTRDGPYSRKKV